MGQEDISQAGFGGNPERIFLVRRSIHDNYTKCNQAERHLNRLITLLGLYGQGQKSHNKQKLKSLVKNG